MRVFMPRILLLHATVGTGHKRAAEALSTAFASYPAAQVRVEDVLDYTPKIFRKAYAGSYLELTDHAPLVWGYFYTQTYRDPDLAQVTNYLRKVLESVGTNDLKDVLKNFLPEIIICTHFLPVELLVRLKHSAKLMPPIYCIVTDYGAHTFWTYTDIDGYFVGAEKPREQLIERGVSPERIWVSGIPIDTTISEPKDPALSRQRRGLPAQGQVITLFGGGVANERLRMMVKDLLVSGINGTLVVVAGRNESMRQALADLKSSSTMTLRVLGFVTYVDDLVAASDLVITKAGGLIISEILARNVPIIVIDPIPGQEEWNADFVVVSGAGEQLRMAESVAATAKRLLQTPFLMDYMRKQAKNVAHPRAAFEIAEKVMKHARERSR